MIAMVPDKHSNSSITLILCYRGVNSFPVMDDISSLLNQFDIKPEERRESILIQCCEFTCKQLLKNYPDYILLDWRRWLYLNHQIHPERPIVFRSKLGNPFLTLAGGRIERN